MHLSVRYFSCINEVSTTLYICNSNVINTTLYISASNMVNATLYISNWLMLHYILVLVIWLMLHYILVLVIWLMLHYILVLVIWLNYIIYSSLEMPREELVARNIGLCSGVRATTSLLMSTVLRPHPGSPSSSIPMHTHRNKDFNFLSSP